MKDRSPLGLHRLRVLRPAGGGALAAVGASPVAPVALQATGAIETFATRLPVRLGDIVALEGPAQPAVAAPRALLRQVTVPDGGTGTPAGPGTPDTVVLFNADIEPDADADGFGDQSQDACFTDATRQDGCRADLRVQTDVSATLGRFEYGKLTMRVTNLGPDPAPGARLRWALPDGLFTGSGGGGIGFSNMFPQNTVFGAIAPGETATAEWEIQARRGGTYSFDVAVRSLISDPDAGNDRTSHTVVAEPRPELTFSVPGAPGAPGAAGPPPFVSPSAPGPAVRLKSRTATVSKRRATSLRVACPAATPGGCRGVRVELRRQARRLAVREVGRVAAGRSAPAALRLSATAFRTLRRAGRLRVQARIRAKDGRGVARTTTFAVTLRRGR